MPETRPPLDINAAGGLDALAAVLAGRSRPPVERWNPEHCGDSGMRIDREGRWWHDGRPIVRPALVRLFASILRREPDGRHVLVTPVEKLDIAVDFAALRVTAMIREGEGDAARIAFQFNDGEAVILGPDQPLAMAEGLPVVTVRGGIQASFERPVYYELAECALTSDPPGVWSGGVFFALGEP